MIDDLHVLDGFRRETVEAVRVVREALALAASQSGAADVTYKSGRDVVTATDIAVEDAVRERIREAFGMSVIGEERGGEVTSSRYWLLDPICGTRNYVSGVPLYSVNLGMVEDGEVTIGVVGDPSRNEIVLAERGRGAWALRDGELHPLKASADSQTIIVEEPDGGDSTARGERREHGARFIAEAIRANRWELRSFGATVSLAYLAAGRFSAYVVFYGTAVHGAAGTIVSSESGCTITDMEGRPWTVQADSLLVAATPELHAELLAMAQRTRP
jgi:myo-inositol-1(or 4)-monophosphatase